MTEIDAVVTCVKNFSDDSPSEPKPKGKFLLSASTNHEYAAQRRHL